MNTRIRGGSFRLWLTLGVLLGVAGWLTARLAPTTNPAPPAVWVGAPEPAALTSDAADAPAILGAARPLPQGERVAQGVDRSRSRAALPWRLEPLGGPAATPLPAGQLRVLTRAPGGHWLAHGDLDVRVGGRVEFPATPAPPFEFRVTSVGLAQEIFVVDDRGFVGDSASEVVIRVAREAYVAVHSRATGEELHSVWIAEAAAPARGASPAFDSPGPQGFEAGYRELDAPFPVRRLAGMERPLVSADGCAWQTLPDRLRVAGGRVLLRPGHEVLVHVEASAVAPVGGIDVLSLQLMEEEVGRWGSSSVSVVLERALAHGGRLEGDFRFSGLPVPIRSAAAEASWRALDPGSGDSKETARGFGGTSLAGDRVEVALQGDTPEDLVEGYIEFADADLAGRVTGAALYGVGGAISVDGLFARKLGLGAGLSVAGDGLLRWECAALRPGSYAMLLQPLGIYCSLEVEGTELGVQTLYSEVPPLVSVGLNLLERDGSLFTGERSVGVTAFVAGAGAERPTITRPLLVAGDAESSPTLELRVPRGARCFVSISAGRRSAEGEFLAKEASLHGFPLEPEMRWVTLRRTVADEEVAAPLRWWQQNVYRLNERGEEEAIVYRSRTPQGAPGRSAFTAWGLTSEREPSSELDVAIPAEAGTLVVRGAFAGVGDEVIDVGADVREVVVVASN
ncbi:hypothetical protein Poly30_50110 [Planctomycetes bacterium Poly30]|uniref:Uncharacterized protein n=1 Tax=Saltatorellus ferox TaxID=2528018 RepID=A0A518EZC9_9BACT|nr:hypothetical protein Poly30_50110 [Planctomycetes bacterium Poly30]